MLWIRIPKDPHHFGNLDPHPDPHQIKIRIWIRIRIRITMYKLYPEPDPDPHQFADVKPKCIDMSFFKHFLKVRAFF